MTNSCKYYSERTLGWMLNNKIIVLLSLLSFSLFVSTLALAGQKNRLSDELGECYRNSLTTPEPVTTDTTENTTVIPESTTDIPEADTTVVTDETIVPTEADTTVLTEATAVTEEADTTVLTEATAVTGEANPTVLPEGNTEVNLTPEPEKDLLSASESGAAEGTLEKKLLQLLGASSD